MQAAIHIHRLSFRNFPAIPGIIPQKPGGLPGTADIQYFAPPVLLYTLLFFIPSEGHKKAGRRSSRFSFGLYFVFCTFRNRMGATFGSSGRVNPPIVPSASAKKVSGRVYRSVSSLMPSARKVS